MSLISDALKTAQRERSGKSTSGSESQPLLEGFFPYVSTSSPTGQSRLVRIVGASMLAVILLGTAAWFSIPSLKRSLKATTSKAPSIVLPERQATVTPPPPPVQIVQAADTQAKALVSHDSSPATPAPVQGSGQRAR